MSKLLEIINLERIQDPFIKETILAWEEWKDNPNSSAWSYPLNKITREGLPSSVEWKFSEERYQSFEKDVAQIWCANCSDWTMLEATIKAYSILGIEPNELWGGGDIGCLGRAEGYANWTGVHSLHGRIIPQAEGIELMNGNPIVSFVGDGGALAIGLQGFIYGLLRNIAGHFINLGDNGGLMLTSHQASPTTKVAKKQSLQMGSNGELPFGYGSLINPVEHANSSQATFVARVDPLEKNLNQVVFTYAMAIWASRYGTSLVHNINSCVLSPNRMMDPAYKNRAPVPRYHDPRDHASIAGLTSEKDRMYMGFLIDRPIPSFQEVQESAANSGTRTTHLERLSHYR